MVSSVGLVPSCSAPSDIDYLAMLGEGRPMGARGAKGPGGPRHLQFGGFVWGRVELWQEVLGWPPGGAGGPVEASPEEAGGPGGAERGGPAGPPGWPPGGWPPGIPGPGRPRGARKDRLERKSNEENYN